MQKFVMGVVVSLTENDKSTIILGVSWGMILEKFRQLH